MRKDYILSFQDQKSGDTTAVVNGSLQKEQVRGTHRSQFPKKKKKNLYKVLILQGQGQWESLLKLAQSPENHRLQIACAENDGEN
jgi:hypothetical protein